MIRLIPVHVLPGRCFEGAAVALLLSFFAWQSLSAIWHKSHTCDEIAHLSSGYSYWKFNEYRLQPENGNLPQRLAGFPLLTRRVNWPPLDQPGQQRFGAFRVGQQLFFGSGNDPEQLVHLGRFGVLIAGLGLGLVVYFWSRRLHGVRGGLLSLTMFSFCPTMLAHGAMITSDMTAALFFLLACWAFWTLPAHVTIGRCLVAGAALAGLCLSKHSAPLFAPMAMILLLLRIIDSRPLPFVRGAIPLSPSARLKRGMRLAIAVAAVIFVAWAIIWAAYGFRYTATAEPLAGRANPFLRAWDELAATSALSERLISFCRRRHLLPEAYLYGLKYTLATAQSRQAFLAGKVSTTGWWWFFPYALLAKTPVSVFALTALSLWAALRASRVAALPGWLARLAPTLPIWTLLTVYWCAAMSSNLNIGHRHIMLTYPAIYILCGVLGPASAARGRVFGGVVLALLLGLMGESFAVRPHYLAFFNAAVGGPSHGYKQLVDSSLDWGQDLPTLKAWLDRNGAPAEVPVFLSYFGTSSPQHYGIRAFAQPGFSVGFRRDNPEYFLPLAPGIYCISATHFQSIYLPRPGPWSDAYESAYQKLQPLYRQMLADRIPPGDFDRVAPELRDPYRDFAALRWSRLCAYLRSRDRRPDANAGYSILIFRLSDQELHEALEGPMPRDPLLNPT